MTLSEASPTSLRQHLSSALELNNYAWPCSELRDILSLSPNFLLWVLGIELGFSALQSTDSCLPKLLLLPHLCSVLLLVLIIVKCVHMVLTEAIARSKTADMLLGIELRTPG